MENKKIMEGIPATGGSLLTTIMSVGSKLAPFAGAAHAWLGDPVAEVGFAGVPEYIWHRLENNPMWNPADGRYHIANPLTTTLMAMQMPDRFPIIPGAVSALTGFIMKKIGKAIDAGVIGQVIEGFGRIAQNYGVSAALNGVAAGWVYLAPYNDSPTGGTMQTRATGYSQGKHAGGAGATNAIWQVRGGAQIRNSTGAVDTFPT